MTEQCFWNPYGGDARHYHAVWDAAKAYEGQRVRVTKGGRTVEGICRLTTVVNPGPGIGITVFDGFADRWIGGQFEAIEIIGN